MTMSVHHMHMEMIERTESRCRQRTLLLPAPMVMTMSVHHMSCIMEEFERTESRWVRSRPSCGN